MGCGAGVCLACVQRIRRDGREQWIRVCKDGPVLDAREIVWK
jgi:dihydroorotate dehydrogenase electron transfer subunit